jgi:pimeloyl-ACP methyl ester carboxylesterase
MVAASRIRRGVFAALIALLPGCARLVGGEAGVVLQAAERGAANTELGRITPAPQRHRFADHDRWTPADTPPRATLILAPGFSEAGRDDPRLVLAADAFARAGFLVRVPVLPGAQALTLDARDTLALRAAARAEGQRTALAAISYAAGPALLAARAEPGVALLLTLGGYGDLTAAATFALTGAHRLPGETAWRFATQNPFAAAAFLSALAPVLPEARDRVTLTAAAARRRADPAAPLDDLAADAGAGAASAFALLAERDPDRIPARLAALPARAREALASLDPAPLAFDATPPCTVLVHGLADPVIPPTQSEALAPRLPRARLILVPGFGHVEPAAVPLAGQLRLIEAVRALLDFRDGRDPCA